MHGAQMQGTTVALGPFLATLIPQLAWHSAWQADLALQALKRGDLEIASPSHATIQLLINGILDYVR